MRSRLLPLAMLATMLLGTATAVADEGPDSITVFEGSGDSAGASWFRHKMTVDQAADLHITLEWDDPSANLNLFLKKAGQPGNVAQDNSTANPKTIDWTVEEGGTWLLFVKVKTGASAFTITAEETFVGTPPPPQPNDVMHQHWQTNGRVRDMIRVGDQLWITGHFTTIRPPGTSAGDPAELSRPKLAVLDVTTGEPVAFTPPALDGNGWALAASPDGSTVYVGGTFMNADGQFRKRIAAVDTTTGDLTSFDPKATSLVRALEVLDDGTVLVGGQFGRVGGIVQPYLGAVDPVTGDGIETFAPVLDQLTGEACPPRCEPYIDALTVGNDGQLYIGGHFGLVNGTPRTNAAAIDAATGTTTLPWHPYVHTPNGSQPGVVNTIAVPPVGSTYDDRVLICGDFKYVKGNLSTNAGLVDDTLGEPIPGWIVQTNGGTPGCAVNATTVYLGGHFTKVGTQPEAAGGTPRSHVAAFDLADGTILAWNPGVNSVLGIHGIRLEPDALYVGGDFTKSAGMFQRGIGTFPIW